MVFVCPHSSMTVPSLTLNTQSLRALGRMRRQMKVMESMKQVNGDLDGISSVHSYPIEAMKGLSVMAISHGHRALTWH